MVALYRILVGRLLATLISLLIVAGGWAKGDAPPPSLETPHQAVVPSGQIGSGGLPLGWEGEFGWALAPAIMGDNSRFAADRKQIDYELDHADNPVELIDKLRCAVPTAPSIDPHTNPDAFREAKFEWAYAAIRDLSGKLSASEQDARWSGLPRGLSVGDDNGPFPYDYARIRFLVDCRVRSFAPLILVGEQLLAIQPRDEPVLLSLRRLCIANLTEANGAKAIAVSQKLLSLHPSDADSYERLGVAYLYSWSGLHHYELAPKAVSAFEKSIALARKGHSQDNARIIAEAEGWLVSANNIKAYEISKGTFPRQYR